VSLHNYQYRLSLLLSSPITTPSKTPLYNVNCAMLIYSKINT
jgi:hypothetical protein